MIDDELQVQGKSRRMSKREKWKIAIAAIVLLILVVFLGITLNKAYTENWRGGGYQSSDCQQSKYQGHESDTGTCGKSRIGQEGGYSDF